MVDTRFGLCRLFGHCWLLPFVVHYGFPSWPKLKSYVQTIQPYWRPLEPKSDDDANRFLRLACITYFDGDHPSRRDRARQLLAAQPQLAKANIYTAAAVGDVAAVADLQTKNADVHAKGGPFDWQPLLYAAYSRLDSEADEHSTLEAARLLLERGADPNAGFLWEGGYQGQRRPHAPRPDAAKRPPGFGGRFASARRRVGVRMVENGETEATV